MWMRHALPSARPLNALMGWECGLSLIVYDFPFSGCALRLEDTALEAQRLPEGARVGYNAEANETPRFGWPVWRNGIRGSLKNCCPSRACGFESHHRHHFHFPLLYPNSPNNPIGVEHF